MFIYGILAGILILLISIYVGCKLNLFIVGLLVGNICGIGYPVDNKRLSPGKVG